MRIPVDASDSDVVICNGLRVAREALASVTELEQMLSFRTHQFKVAERLLNEQIDKTREAEVKLRAQREVRLRHNY